MSISNLLPIHVTIEPKRGFLVLIYYRIILKAFLAIARIVKSYCDLQTMYSFYLSPLACIISQSPYSVYVVSSSHYIFWWVTLISITGTRHAHIMKASARFINKCFKSWNIGAIFNDYRVNLDVYINYVYLYILYIYIYIYINMSLHVSCMLHPCFATTLQGCRHTTHQWTKL